MDEHNNIHMFNVERNVSHCVWTKKKSTDRASACNRKCNSKTIRCINYHEDINCKSLLLDRWRSYGTHQWNFLHYLVMPLMMMITTKKSNDLRISLLLHFVYIWKIQKIFVIQRHSSLFSFVLSLYSLVNILFIYFCSHLYMT